MIIMIIACKNKCRATLVFLCDCRAEHKCTCTTHQCLLCTPQCIWSEKHLLYQVSHSGRSHPLQLSSGAKVPHSDLWFCGSPTPYSSWEPEFHWERTSSQRQLLHQYKALGNNCVGQLCRAGHHHLHQCPPG